MAPFSPRCALTVAVLSVALGCCDEGDAQRDTDDAGADAADATARPFEFEIGVLDKQTGAFSAIVRTDTLDIVIGFQGLVFVELALQSDEPLLDHVGAEVDVTFPDRHEFDYEFWQNRIEFEPTDDGSRVAPEFWIPFGQDVALINGLRVEIAVRLGGDEWTGSAESTFLVEDLDGCLMTSTGEMQCDEPTE